MNPWHNASNEPRFLTELDDCDDRTVLFEGIEGFLALVNGKHERIFPRLSSHFGSGT